ncbi:MAG: LytR/AlgR family response regulator transcription factor [Flammeovirgaceae bacterium]
MTNLNTSTRAITAIIVDDELRARNILSKILKKYCPDVELLAQAASVKQAHELIVAHEPELVFLDVEMPDGTGFDVLSKFTKIDFKVIFTTAYDHYAINAIKISAVDYLLKPINIQELMDAVKKVQESEEVPPTANEQIQQLISQLSHSNTNDQKIGLPTGNGIQFVEITDIIRCEADGNYTKLFLKNNKMIYTTRKIKEYEKSFECHRFFRVHHSHLINEAYVQQYLRGEGGSVVMNDGSEIPISRRRKEAFLNRLNIL